MYLTVKEASDLTGKSATTIYRLCNKRRNSLYIKKEDNKFFINKDFLLATYPSEEKRISEIIENGSKELGEPVFLEIEPKLKEVSIPVLEKETIVYADGIDLPVENNVEIENVSEPFIKTTSNIESYAVTENLTVKDKETDNKKIREQIIGLSIMIFVLAALLLLIFNNVN